MLELSQEVKNRLYEERLEIAEQSRLAKEISRNRAGKRGNILNRLGNILGKTNSDI